MEKIREKKDDLLILLLLAGFAFLVNHGIEIKGLYMDDLYLWSCYGEQSFFQYVFPIGSTRFRFLYYLAAWLQMAIVGNRVGWFVPVNILLNIAVAFTLYRMARRLSRSVYIGALCGISYLASRMAYYQIGQVYGLMETMALWLAIGILYLLYDFYNAEPGREQQNFIKAAILYVAVCFVHERYMVSLPLFFLVLLMKGKKYWKKAWIPLAAGLLVQVIRLLTIGGLAPAGTGGTDVADTFSVGNAIKYALSQVAYIFGINAGPAYLNGENFRDTPLWVMILIAIANLMLLIMVVALIFQIIRSGKNCGSVIANSLLFIGFIAGCIACSSVTIRVEMRWVYVSFAAALLYLAWIYGTVTKADSKKGRWLEALPYLVVISIYVILMLPVEFHYRNQFSNIYLWPNQMRYNSLAEETYEKYGDDIFGKDIYIIGNSYEMSEFTANTFFKVFDRKRRAEDTQVIFIEDIRDIGLVADDMIILREEPEFNCFQDITRAVKELKCRPLYGYYDDGWLDERAEVQVMAGATGQLELDFYYPRELQSEQWISIYVNGIATEYLSLDTERKSVSIQVEPYETVTLKFENNFHVPDAQEQRGEYKLSVLMQMRAD